MEWESITYDRRGKINRFIFHVYKGLKDEFPICCILRFSIETALKDGKTFYFKDGYKSPVQMRGTIQGKKSRFIPCGIFHKREE